MTEEEKAKKEEERKKLLDSAKALIDSGMEPAQVGQMLLGLTPTGTTPTATQGMTFDDAIKLVNLIVGKKETDELKTLVASLDKKIDELAKGGGGKVEIPKPPTPMEYAQQQVEYIGALRKLGLIPAEKTSPVTEKGEPLDVVKEKNRHDEKMEEIRGDQRYKEKLSDTLAEIPERIGRGIAGRITEEGEEEPSGGNSGGVKLEYLTCTEPGCGTKIPITPETGSQVTCPKCGSIYSRKETVAPGK